MFIPALTTRSLDSNKGDFGSVAIIGGDTGMIGAVLLAARAALLCGAGRVYAYFLANDAPCVDMRHPEIMLHSAQTLNQFSAFNSVVIGTGLGQTKTAADLLEFCMAQNSDLLIDADALNLLAKHPYLQNALKNRQGSAVITPHPAEAARLLNVTVEYVQLNRLESAQKLANYYSVICVLKGAGTIIASPIILDSGIPKTTTVSTINSNFADSNLMVTEFIPANKSGEWFINTTGNPSLASGGTGDVLSGIIGSLFAQGLDCLQAAKLGVYVHGAAADSLVANGIGPVGLTASEIALEARNQINLLNKLDRKNFELEDALIFNI